MSYSESYGYKGHNCITMRFLLNDGFEIPAFCIYPEGQILKFDQELNLTRKNINFTYSDKQYFPNDKYQINLGGAKKK
uniref:Uncharacterized protein n=1 Tax=Megaselia scalaris TaxID=36166 RepID=T1H218_MEGSC